MSNPNKLVGMPLCQYPGLYARGHVTFLDILPPRFLTTRYHTRYVRIPISRESFKFEGSDALKNRMPRIIRWGLLRFWIKNSAHLLDYDFWTRTHICTGILCHAWSSNPVSQSSTTTCNCVKSAHRMVESKREGAHEDEICLDCVYLNYSKMHR